MKQQSLDDQHIFSQHALWNILSPLLRPIAQGQRGKSPFKILPLTGNTPGHQ